MRWCADSSNNNANSGINMHTHTQTSRQSSLEYHDPACVPTLVVMMAFQKARRSKSVWIFVKIYK